MKEQPILYVWINHDNDLVDLTITPSARVPEAPVSKGKGQPSETLHTNKKYPFLTVEQGFLPVGEIKVEMHVQRADGTYNGSTATLSYDLLDQLVQWNAGASSQEWYAYDLAGNRTLRRSTTGSGTTITVSAFGLEEHVYSSSGTPQSSTYYYPLGGRLIGELQGSATQFFLSDALGSILTTFTATAGSASVQGNQLYGPSGSSRYSQGTMGTTKGFTGQYADATGLDYYNARYYDPVIGRFLSADSVQGNTSGMDPYGYVGGNPETLTDPSGLRYGQVAGGGGGPSCDQSCQALKQVPGGGSSCDLACQLDKDGVGVCKVGSTCVVNTAVKGPSSVMPVRTGGTSSSLLACGGSCILINTVTPPQTINLHVETAFQAQMCLTVWGVHACDGGGGDDTEGEEGPSTSTILASDPAGDAVGGGDPPDGWTKMDDEPHPLDSTSTTRPTEFGHVNGKGDHLDVSFYSQTGDLQVAWMDRLGQLRTHLPTLLDWLGDDVQSISGRITDEFYEKYFSTEDARQDILPILNKIASSKGFGPATLEQVGNNLWLRFVR